MNNSSPVTTFNKVALGLAISCALTLIELLFVGNLMEIGPFLIALFIMVAIGCWRVNVLKPFSFTMMIFAAATTALFYPAIFIEWKGFKLDVLVSPLFQVIMFGMGTSMSFNDFADGARMPKGVLVGISSHFLVMPLVGYGLAKASGFPPEISAGMILIGCSPNGMVSNVISYLAKANLALSITITAFSTLLAPIVMPLLTKWLTGASVEIKGWDMMLEITKTVMLPVLGGLLFKKFFPGKAKWLDKMIAPVSMFGIAFIIVIITASGRDSILAVGPLLLLLVLIHNLSGYAIGYWIGRLCRMSDRDCRTVAIDVGMENGGLASALAGSVGRVAAFGFGPAVFAPLMNTTGSILASWWHHRSRKSQEEKRTPTKTAVVHY